MDSKFLSKFAGWKDEFPNLADRDSTTSVAIASELLKALGVTEQISLGGQQAGRALEVAVEEYLRDELPDLRPDRQWEVARGRRISTFQQYAHLKRLDELIRQDESGTLGSELGRDYLISPDVTVGISLLEETDLILHAAVSCKLTIRSDRVQNIRHEGVIMTRHRRGRQPHVVVVTSEPLPTRLAAIARGTGEVDAVYHVALEELEASTKTAGTPEQQQTIIELVTQGRLKPLEALVEDLSL